VVVRALAAVLGLTVIAAACSSTPEYTTLPAPTSSATPATGAATQPAATVSPATPSYMTMTLTDVRTGERFTLGGFAGKVVIVEGMAVW